MKFKLIRFSLGLLIFLIFTEVIAQEADTVKTAFSLEEAVGYALNNSTNMKNALLDEKSAKARIGEIRAAGLPQVNGSVQLSHSDPLRRMFFGVSDNNPILGDLSNFDELKEGSIVAFPNFFQLPSTGDAGISISQLIFNGSYLVGLKAASTYRDLATKATEQSRINTVEKVTKAYYTVLINRERLKLFEENIARVDTLLKNTEGLYKNGFAEKIDVSRVKVAMNNLIIEKEKFYNLMELSSELLKFQMNFPMDKAIVLSDNIDLLNLNEIDASLLNSTLEHSNRVEFELLRTQEELSKLDIKNNKVKYLPTISAFANLGYFTQSPDIGGLFKTNTRGIPENSGIGPDKWYQYGMFGVNLSIPIFDGLSKSYQVQQSKIELLKIQNNFEALQSSIELQVNQSKISLINSLSTLNSQKENVELAEEVARVTKIKYISGVGSNFEVTEAETALKEAQLNYYNAIYDVAIAQIDLQVALGTLTK